MIKLYTSPTLPLVAYLRDVLDQAGLRCLIKNEHLAAGAGELPPIETWPELWLLEDEGAARARELVAEFTREDPAADGPPWICSDCGERNDAILARCWNCLRPDPAA